MNNSTVFFITPETSTNSTTQSFGSLNMFFYSIGFLFGFPTHSYVMWLIITGTGSGVASEFFNLNLSVCEIVSSLTGLISVLAVNFSTLSYFLQGLSITGRPLFQCLMCVERYLAVVHPVTFLKYKPLRYRVICCTVAWIITLASCLYCMFIVSCYYVCFYSIQFLLFCSIQLFCCVSVLRALKQSGPGERGREREEENHMKRRAFYLILITTVSMNIMYMPFAITGLTYILTYLYFQKTFTFELFCYLLTGFVQPFLYLNMLENSPVLNKNVSF